MFSALVPLRSSLRSNVAARELSLTDQISSENVHTTMHSKHSLVIILSSLAISGSALADNPPIPTPYIPTFQSTAGLGTTVVTDAWTNLTLDNHPTYPTLSSPSQAWPAPIGSDVVSARNALLGKTPGFEGDYTDFLDAASGGGVYSFFSNTHFEITSGVSLANTNALQLQISMAEGATPADVVVGPTLTLATTSGTFTLSPTSSSLLSQTPVTIAAFGNTQTTIDLEGYNWDLSAYAGTISNITVDWQVDMHSITYGAQLAQAVPEPSSSWLVALPGAFVMLGRRFRWRKLA